MDFKYPLKWLESCPALSKLLAKPKIDCMKKMLCLLAFCAAIACQKKPKPSEVQQHLKKAMAEFLYQSVNNDSSKVRFEVKDVIYFEEPEAYECEFNVRMIQSGKDTTGVMKATVTKDFAKVNRKL
jgi:hypothetical protein